MTIFQSEKLCNLDPLYNIDFDALYPFHLFKFSKSTQSTVKLYDTCIPFSSCEALYLKSIKMGLFDCVLTEHKT